VPRSGGLATIPCTDPEGDPLTFRFAGQSPGLNGGPPDQGTVQYPSDGPIDTFRFTPAPNFGGIVSVFFIANDGTSDSNTAQITITVVGNQPPPGPLPQPQPGQTSRATVVSGAVRVRRPGSSSFEYLNGTVSIPVGSVLDLTRGRIRLTTAVGTGAGRRAASRTQSAEFFDGSAVFTQDRRSGLTTLTLTRGDFSSCPGGKQAWNPFATAARQGNRVWGSGKGRFRTRGRYSAATVRGTTWLVQDTCAGTLTRVKTGTVEVNDFVRHRTVVVRTGRRYLAKRG
jgi:hypothetical protein